MSRSDAIAELATDSGELIRLSVPAHSECLVVVRSVVESALYMGHWGADEIVDAKLGLDEICSSVISAAADGSRVDVVVEAGPRGMLGRVFGTLAGRIELDRSSFGWQVVSAVTDAQRVSYLAASSPNWTVQVQIAKFRS